MTRPRIVDLFAGPGGWSEGLRSLGLTDFGLEHDAAACSTRYAAGHASWQVDVTSLDPFAFGNVDGLIASPPCPDFSSSGKRLGLQGETGPLVYEVLRWADALEPRWIACEQVPAVLPIWRLFARHLETNGYSTAVGILNAADYGVPQTRRRAILLASRTERVVLPEPTHCEGGDEGGMFGEPLLPWITMADALGWGFPEPSPTVSGGGTRTGGAEPFANAGTRRRLAEVVNTRQRSLLGGQRTVDYKRSVDLPAPTLTLEAGAFWQWEYPATTVAGDPRITARCHHDEGSQGANPKTTDQVRAGDYEGTEPVKLTIEEGLTLQGFRPDYPVQGGRGKQWEQIGNAVPPPLAAAVLRQVIGT